MPGSIRGRDALVLGLVREAQAELQNGPQRRRRAGKPPRPSPADVKRWRKVIRDLPRPVCMDDVRRALALVEAASR